MGRASRNKRTRRDGAEAAFRERVRRNLPIDDVCFRRSSQAKLSDSLAEVVRPYIDDDMPLEAFESLVAVAVLAWNSAVSPMLDAKPELKQLLASEDLHSDMRELIAILRRRKQTLFRSDNRFIVDFEARREPGGGFYLQIASAQPRPGDRE